jgi:hypothetical protein
MAHDKLLHPIIHLRFSKKKIFAALEVEFFSLAKKIFFVTWRCIVFLRQVYFEYVRFCTGVLENLIYASTPFQFILISLRRIYYVIFQVSLYNFFCNYDNFYFSIPFFSFM